MKIIDFIQKLQDKPRRIRLRILWLFVFVCMLIVVSLWVFSLKYSLSNKTDKGAVKEFSKSVEEIKKEVPSLMDSLKANIGAFLKRGEENKALKSDSRESEEIQFEKELDGIKPAKLPLAD